MGGVLVVTFRLISSCPQAGPAPAARHPLISTPAANRCMARKDTIPPSFLGTAPNRQCTVTTSGCPKVLLGHYFGFAPKYLKNKPVNSVDSNFRRFHRA